MTAGKSSPVLLTVEDGVAEIRFNRPDVLNAIDVETARAFREAAQAAIRASAVRVILLSAEGRAFVAGGDLRYFLDAGEEAPAAAKVLIEPIHGALSQLRAAPQPVLASLQGAVVGAGMSIALSADLAIAADDVAFNMAYSRIGATPDCSATWTLPRLLGLRKAMEIALLAETIHADEALRLGLVNRIAPRAELDVAARGLARRIASLAPLAAQGLKRLFAVSFGNTLEEQLAAEEMAFIEAAGSREFREALAAFFFKPRHPTPHEKATGG